MPDPQWMVEAQGGVNASHLI